MADQDQAKPINDNSTGKGFEAFHASFKSVCERASVHCTPAALEQLGQEGKQHTFFFIVRL